MSTSDGRVTNAVYGFTSMLAIVLASRPEYAIAAFDLGKPTFRSQEYVEDYGTVESLLQKVDELPEGRLKKALKENADRVRLGKRMVTIVRDVPIELELEKARWTRYDYDRARRVFDHLEFRQLLTRFPPPDQVPVQPSLTFEPAPRAAGLQIVEDPAEAASLLNGSQDVGVFTFTEGSGRGCRVCGLGVSTAGRTFYVARPDAMDAVASTLSGRPISGHDAKETELALRSLGGGKREWAFSTFLAAYLLGAGSRDPRLEDLAREFLGMELVSSEQLLGTGRAARKPSTVAETEAAEFAARRAEAILNLRPRLEAEMRNLGVDYLFHEIELPLAGVLADMESEGVAIDVPYLKQMQEELGGQLAAIESEVEQVAGQKFNLNAPQQLAKVLFEDLRLPVGKRTKTGYSTDADTLEALREKHPIIGLILEHRQLSKLKSTYVDALPQLVDSLSGRVHTSFGQASTATGRLASSNPNLMNIPIRTELGQRLRRAFKAGRPDHIMVSADYSQIELRIAAHLSGDPMLLGAFAAGQDIHTATAAAVFKIPIEQVDPNQRRLAKGANFGSIYGQGEYGLSQQLGITGDVAREFLGQYWSP